MTVHTAVHVNRDSLETGQLVKVYDTFLLKKTRSQVNQYHDFFPRVINSDIDECSADSSPCDSNADCTNRNGSYSCTCKQGFSGDGIVCTGVFS